MRPFGVWCTRKEVKDGGSSMTASLSFFIGEKMKKYPYNIERAVNGLSMKNPGWSIDVLLIADLVMEYIGKNNVSVDQVELSLVNGCLGINGILVERVALLPGINVKVTSKAEDLEDRILAREETI